MASAVVALAIAISPSAAAQAPAAQKAAATPKPATTPSTAWPDFQDRCTCEQLDKRLKSVEKEGEVYKDLAKEGERFDTFGQLNAEVGRRMGWNNTYSIGKGGDAATAEEKRDARTKCIAEGNCAWICDVSINGVHEKYHDWWDKQLSTSDLASRELNDFIDSAAQMYAGLLIHVGPTHWRRSKDKVRSEIGAHDAEATFLREQIAKAQQRGTCKGLEGTPSPQELEKRFKEARDRTDAFLRTISP